MPRKTAKKKPAKMPAKKPARKKPSIPPSKIPPGFVSPPDKPIDFSLPNADDRYPSLRDQFYRSLRTQLLGESADVEKQQATEETERLRELCRRGNPFPLIAHQWPFLVIEPDHPDHSIFRENLGRIDGAKITDAMRAAILDPDNPTLRLDWWQYIVIAGFFDPSIGEVSIKGATGTGKGSAVGMGVCLWFDAYGNSRIHLTGRDHQHTLDNIFSEGVVKWRVQMQRPMEGRLTSRSIEGDNSDTGGTNYIHTINPSVSSSTSGEKFSGAHGENTLYVFDECTSHPDDFFKNAAKNARTIVKLANPRTMAGQFRRDFEALDDINSIGIVPGTLRMRLCVTVSGRDCINVARERLKAPVGPQDGITIRGKHYGKGKPIPAADFDKVRPLIPNQIDLDKFNSIMASPDKRVEVPVFGLGRFPDEDPQFQVILPSWLPIHQQAHYETIKSGGKIPVDCFGLDVARSFDGDSSAIAAGSETGIAEIHEKKINSTIGVAKWICGVANKYYGINLRAGKNPVCVDMGGGYGGGVVDQLRSEGVWVIEFHPSATSEVNPRMWGNMRAQGYAMLGGRLDPTGPFSQPDESAEKPIHSNPWAMPANDRLQLELVAPEKSFERNKIRFKIEPKDDIKRKLNGNSPDYADAAVYLWHAVTEFRNLQSYFASYSGPLTVWPAPTAKQSEWLEFEDRKRAAEISRRENGRQETDFSEFTLDTSKADGDNADGERLGPADGDSGGGAAGARRPESPTLAWLRQRYGNSGESGRGKYDRLFGD